MSSFVPLILAVLSLNNASRGAQVFYPLISDVVFIYIVVYRSCHSSFLSACGVVTDWAPASILRTSYSHHNRLRNCSDLGIAFKSPSLLLISWTVTEEILGILLIVHKAFRLFLTNSLWQILIRTTISHILSGRNSNPFH